VRFVAISPNGKLLAQDDVKPGSFRILIWDVDSSKTQRVVNIDTGNKLRGVRWSDDQTVLIDVSVQKAMPCNANNRCTYEWLRTMAVTLDGSPPRMLLMDDASRQWVTGAEVLTARPNRPHSVTMQSWDYLATREKQATGTRIGNDRDRSGWTSVVFDVDTRTGKGRPLATGTAYTDQWIVDRAGDPVARSEWRASNESFAIVARQGSSWREVFRQTKKGELSLAGTTLDGKSIVAIGTIDSDRSKAWAIPLDGSPMTVLYEDPNGDVSHAVFEESMNAVVGVQTGGLDTSVHWLDPTFASQGRSLATAFSGKRVHMTDRSQDGLRAIVAVDSPSRPPTYQFVDFDKSRADVIGESYPALAKAALGEVRLINYAARDGTSIPAYLTLPPGRGAKNLPLVVLPHGGPEARDEGNFDWLAQFLATRGYLVLQPQFRGSTGFGDAFRRAGYRQWGGLMQDDVTDGVRHFIADGTADPTRICIVGASYGGYAALAGGAFTPDVYACVASIAGVSDLPTMLVDSKRSHGEDSDTIAYWKDHIGSPSNPEVAAKSPARFAANFRVPVLLLHGVDDSVVPIAQSERMAKALERVGKPVTFIKLPGEDHWLSRGETRLQVLQELEKFLAQYLR
jgi:dipeptidyl aminopeptidase/acylaminoacyl peptidase